MLKSNTFLGQRLDINHFFSSDSWRFSVLNWESFAEPGNIAEIKQLLILMMFSSLDKGMLLSFLKLIMKFNLWIWRLESSIMYLREVGTILLYRGPLSFGLWKMETYTSMTLKFVGWIRMKNNRSDPWALYGLEVQRAKPYLRFSLATGLDDYSWSLV